MATRPLHAAFCITAGTWRTNFKNCVALEKRSHEAAAGGSAAGRNGVEGGEGGAGWGGRAGGGLKGDVALQ